MRNLILTLIIWIICFSAIVVGASMSYKLWKYRGEDITISFTDVEGLVPNQSKIMYKGAEIGTVKEILLDVQTGNPVIYARINHYVKPMLGENSIFWVVRPELGVGAINHLSAISTGDYIGVYPVPGKFSTAFKGRDNAPIDDEYDAGLRIILKAASADGIDAGSPVLYKDLQIGEVGEMGLSKDKKYVVMNIYINKPYVDVIRKCSYFGNVSGFHADIHIFGGSKIGLNSLRTLVKGGVSVVTPNFHSSPAAHDDVYVLLNRDQFAERQDQ